jgi:prephenate dehydrogenase
LPYPVTTEVADAVDGAGFIILATPVGAMPGLAQRMLETRLMPGVIVTDVGSVKGFVAKSVAPLFDAAGVTFIGSHPMAGGELAGFDAAREDLFEGAPCILTPHAHSLDPVRTFWQRLGCVITVMTPDEHDSVIARVSHLPHVAASAVAVAALGGPASALDVCGRGFLDTTRIAAGDPDLWTEILMQNRDALRQPLTTLIDRLRAVLDFLENGDEEALRRFLVEGKLWRDRAAGRTSSNG